jgi:cytochrome c oxidase subunit II
MLAMAVVVMAVVLVSVCIALFRGMRNQARDATSFTSERTLARAVSAAVGTTVVILVGLLVASVWTGRLVGSLQASSAVTIEIIGHQWWWEIQYEDAVASRRVITANEFHIPVNRPVVLKVSSRDVIHSLWVPNLRGKRDLIPGYTTAIWIHADRPGIFRGQCAEFCGLQHAHMALDVVAESDGDFAAWLDAMRQPAPAPHGAGEQRGRDL